MRARLERAELPEAEIEAAIDELLEFGYLDDARYARVFTQDKRTLEAWGNERIARALASVGWSATLIDGALMAEAGAADGMAAREQRTRARHRAAAAAVPDGAAEIAGPRARVRRARPQGLRQRARRRRGQSLGAARAPEHRGRIIASSR